jgi:hypothetical protein
MATRVSGSSNLTGQSLINALKRKTSKREISTNFVGLQRGLALADINSGGKALNNVLKKISILDTLETKQYSSPYDAADWSVTSDFLPEQIDKDFLSQLSGASIGGGSLGSTVSINPRIRIQDRLNFLNSFYGEGSYPGLHSGFDAHFYREVSPQFLGYVKFNFNTTTGVITVSELKDTDGTTNTSAGALLGSEFEIVFTLSEYTTPEDGKVILEGLNAEIRLQNPNTWTINGYADLDEDLRDTNPIYQIRDVVGSTVFPLLKFKITRPFSYKNVPQWFTESPNDSGNTPRSADDLNPATSSQILANQGGIIVPYIEKGYWFSKAFVETRWTAAERSRLTATGQNNVIIAQDSNMRWQLPPSKLRNQTYNWGVRWDGYLRITPGIYTFEVQTNVAIKIDMAIASGGVWSNVFSTYTAAQESEQMYISASTFSTENLDSKYKYKFGTEVDDWIAYVPITIRLYHGGPDRVNPEYPIPSEPNLFIKTTTVSSAKTYYSKTHYVTLAGTDGDWTITGDTSSEILAVLNDANASVSYSLTEANQVTLVPAVGISLGVVSGAIKSTITGLTAGPYTLKISTNRSGFGDLKALWKGRVASPSVAYKFYDDLINGSYIPDVQKLSFDERAEWWKVSEGHPYNLSSAATPDNTPLDGFIKNSFKSVLRSDADQDAFPQVGLYGNGSRSYSSKPNIILGEARYNNTEDKGSNYIGLRLTPNLLGEGGKIIIDAYPANNSVYDDANLLGQNDLGGGTNHQTVSAPNVVKRVMRLYLWDNDTQPEAGLNNKYYLQSDLTALTTDDDPTLLGLPPFSSNAWLSPISVFAVRLADDELITTGVEKFVAPLVLTAERKTIGARTLVLFSTTLQSILEGGDELAQFTTKYIEFYTQDDIAFQYARVDNGTSFSIGDVVKMTYDAGVFQAFASEVPQADRAGPFGYDKPEFSSGICYPPFATTNPFLTETAVEDNVLYAAPIGNYDVIWGNPAATALGGNVLTISEKLEFQSNDNTVVESAPTLDLPLNSYTHKFKVEMPLVGSYDPDMLEHVGNGEKVKEAYYCFVNIA